VADTLTFLTIGFIAIGFDSDSVDADSLVEVEGVMIVGLKASMFASFEIRRRRGRTEGNFIELVNDCRSSLNCDDDVVRDL
jgi:hypothetical protein